MPPKGKNKQTGPIPVESIRHKDKRVNIPTEELRDFVVEGEQAPKTMLYPRDPSLDPQLVWRGKDEQDREDLAVPVVPIYIQEKIHPQALIENLRETAKAGQPEPELTLFDDFNGIEAFDQKVDFYHHDQHWSNRMILGDSLLVMTSLAEKEGLKGKVQCIYFDPPYGIKFGSNWQVSTRKRDVKDGKTEDATRQPEQVRAFRDTWKLGIHSYLAYLRDRLVVARELLTETGSVFVQIGNTNLHLVRNLLDEVFGSDNSVALISFVTTGGQTTIGPAPVTDYVLWYAKDAQQVRFHPLLMDQERKSLAPTISWYVELDDAIRPLQRHEVANPASLPEASRLLWLADLLSRSGGESSRFSITFDSRRFAPSRGGWRTGREGMQRLVWADRLHIKGSTLLFKRFLEDYPYTELSSLWLDTQMGGFAAKDKVYVVQTNTTVVQRCLLMTTDPGDLVIDPTCGSGTTAYVAEQWGRRWITIDTSRVALALARTRLMAAKYPYYLLADSKDGVMKEAEATGKIPPEYPTGDDVRKGFVYKRVPHVTLKSIANNPDIKEGMTREQIDAAIARHAETELLYDQPYDDKKRLRVSGPFTVESLSPHRVLSLDEDFPESEDAGRRDSVAGQFETMILENLRKAGVQNTVRNERLTFDRLEPFAGKWIQGTGEYTDADKKVKRVAVVIGPEHGTVGPQLVKEAAKEAVLAVGFDILVVCGFAFDPHVSEEATRYGKLTVLATRMNPDLAMGDELLKKTGAGNLFMVFGEPDVDIRKTKDGKIEIEVRGVDVYDPTTGQIRSSSTDDIACWFIDTNYNGESFFVRHAYFTGGDEPYEKLKRALRSEIDEGAWSTLYSTVSRPFDQPETGKIAVKVINHYGDEVLKVFTL
jgi:adenine-specific DNA-methyltransferase